jgi:hypothetical protein
MTHGSLAAMRRVDSDIPGDNGKEENMNPILIVYERN